MSEMHDPSSETLPGWDGAAYAANTGHHRAQDRWFLTGFPARRSDRVLDVGCGAGDFTAIVAGLVPDGHVVGLDPHQTMLDQAGEVARANQSFVCGRAQRLAAVTAAAAPFDGVISRATLHWVPAADHPGVLDQIAAVTAPGGWVRIELGGHGNIARVVEVLAPLAQAHGGTAAPWTFPDAGTYLELLEAAGLDATRAGPTRAGQPDGYVHTVAQRRAFSPTALRGWLTSQCLAGFRTGMTDEAFTAFEAEALAATERMRRADGSHDQTFVRLDLLAYRRP